MSKFLVDYDLHGCISTNHDFKIGEMVVVKGYVKPRKIAGWNSQIMQTYLNDPDNYTQHRISDCAKSGGTK